MVSDAFKIFCDHQQVERIFAVRGVLRDLADQTLLDLREVAVYGVVLRDDLLCQHCITFYIRVNAFRHHADGGLRHLAQEVVVLGLMAVEKADDLGDVLGLIADALHVRDHLERRGDLAQVARDRLLLKQQLEAEVLDVALLPVDLAVERRDPRGKTLVVFGQRTAGERDDLLAQRAHFDHFVIELRELLVKFVSHQPNLPVM